MPSTSGTVRSYLNCQIFMVTRHGRRLSSFQQEAVDRLSTIGEEERREAGSAEREMERLLADAAKMRTRCKHVLDVTDRYCVLTDEDLRIDANLGQHRILGEAMSDDDLDTTKAFGTSSIPAAPSSPLPASPITQHIVRSTLESFGSHLSVIAKTYTRRRGHSFSSEPNNSKAGQSSTPSSPMGTSEANGLFSAHWGQPRTVSPLEV